MEIQTADLGVLLNHSQLCGALRGRYQFEYLPFYSEAAEKAGVTVVFFSNRSLLGETGYTYAYVWNPDTNTYEQGVYKIPSVVHNRALLLKKGGKQIYSFIARDGTILYNRIMRFDKWEVHRHLVQNPQTAQYIPDTERLRSDRQILSWLRKYQTVYLKPRSGSLGWGVVRLRLSDAGLIVSRTVAGCSRHHTVPLETIAGIRHKIGKRPYLIQEAIPLIQLDEQPIDFRVTVQKGEKGEWTISGAVAKIGVPNAHATNLAVGARAAEAKQVLDSVFSKSEAAEVYRDLKKASLRIARQMEQIGPEIADLGLDLAVTEDGKVKFIEANGRDLRIAFHKANQRQMWRNTFYTPILYGAYLLRKRGSGK
ncbi:YheC/YheD family endospore coat-associated protein [Effusibacillus pohliae]|uniref:YheC/YheD family endospore coat-associated protein n=1 Tax=Effusibacillus pohliae TaxID=232270 RepID=UPI00035C305B|nr:YheC/YheD family protein [Effusibacillus pohliae]